jgi:6,7-dimethyl-8-ribityllumazine synthase/transcription antitermination factor NusB
MADFSGVPRGEGRRIAVVASRFNESITTRLAEGAVDALVRHGAEFADVDVCWVPGAWELPMAARRALATGRFDGVVAIGAVIRGETPHFDIVAGEAARGLAEASREFDAPVTLGLLTTDTMEQATATRGGMRRLRCLSCSTCSIASSPLATRTVSTRTVSRRRWPMADLHDDAFWDGPSTATPAAKAPVPVKDVPPVRPAESRSPRGRREMARGGRKRQRVETRGRARALQALYAADLRDFTNLKRIAVQVWDDLAIEPEERHFAARLVSVIVERSAEVDASLSAVTANWRLERLGAIERSVLRLAAAEFLRGETPPRVVLQEAIHLAERYGTERSARFVNGVLDAYARQSGAL